MPDVNNRETWNEKAKDEIWELSVLSAQSFCKPKAATSK
jgi:hypothetical protein